MPRNKVLLSSLSVGRCFTIDAPPTEIEEKAAEKGTEVRRAGLILSPKNAWKVTGEEGDDLVAESAAGEKKTFAGDTKVVEIPRQGYEKLATGAKK